jgi:hypothetical protein
MTNLVSINGTDVPVLHFSGQRVVTLAMVDAVHGRPEGTARKRFNGNRHRFIECEDFYEVTASEIRTQSLGEAFAARTPKGILLTETGYLMLVKSFTDDLAWQVQRQMVNAYFTTRNLAAEVTRLQAENIRLREFAFAGHTFANTIRAYQNAGVRRSQLYAYFTGKSKAWLGVMCDFLEEAGMIRLDDWPDAEEYRMASRPWEPEQAELDLTPIEAAQDEMARQFGG